MKAARSHGAWMLVVVCLLLVTSGCERSADSPPLDGPNLVFVVSDTLRAANLPFYGYGRDTAPNLSKLAEESLVFESHLANYPGTPPSVSQMMSGRLMAPLLISSGASQPPFKRIEPDLLMLPAALREAGAVTGLVSAHPWFDEGARILEHFDWHETVESPDAHPYAPIESLMPPAERFLRQRAEDGRRFFLYLHAMDTHQPYRRHREVPLPEGPSPLLAGYDHQILHVDLWVGRLLERLRSLSLDEETIVVFTSDHGEDLGELGPEWWNHGHGMTLNRSQIHVPLLVHVPGIEGRRITRLTQHLDLAPTLLGLMLDDPGLDRYRLDGLDLSAALVAGDPLPPDRTSEAYSLRYWSLGDEESGVIFDQWHDDLQAFRIEKDGLNYPRHAETPASDERANALRDAMSRRYRQMVTLPSDDFPGGSIGIPNRVLPESAKPSYAVDGEDGAWFLKAWMLLRADPQEEPEPLVVETPWHPGTYQLSIRFHREGLREGYANRFRLEVLGSGNPVFEVEGTQAENGRLDLGEVQIGRLLRLRISEPTGGVAIAGFLLRSVDSDIDPSLDPEEEEQLRALGYLD